MGVTIHYRGKLKSPDLIPNVISEIEDICITNNWSYRILGEERKRITDLSESLDENKKTGLLEKITHLDLEGISFKPHEESENMQFIFDKEGALKSVFAAILGMSEAKKAEWIFCKTQFAGQEAHIKLINLLVYLKKKYFKKLEISDEGGYYPNNDIEALETRMGFINNAMNTVSEIFEHSEFKDKSPDQVMEHLKEALSRSFKGVQVQVVKIDANELISGEFKKKIKKKLKKEDENEDENKSEEDL